MSIRSFLSRDVRMRHLRLLVAIDDAGQLTRAARVLHLSQPALSKALAEIERALGTALFERSPRGLFPTAAGVTLIRAARSALGELDRASSELHRPPAEARRVLNVGSMPSASWALLADAVALFRREQPDATIHVVDGQTVGLLTQLVAGRLDLVVGAMWRNGLPADTEAINLFEDRMRLVVPPNHPLTRQRKLAWSRLCEFPWVLQPTGHPTRIAFERAVRRCGWPLPEQVYEALPSDTVVALVRSLGAVGFLPGLLARRLAVERLVKELPVVASDSLAVSLPFTGFVRSDSRQDPAIALLLRCLQAAALKV